MECKFYLSAKSNYKGWSICRIKYKFFVNPVQIKSSNSVTITWTMLQDIILANSLKLIHLTQIVRNIKEKHLSWPILIHISLSYHLLYVLVWQVAGSSHHPLELTHRHLPVPILIITCSKVLNKIFEQNMLKTSKCSLKKIFILCQRHFVSLLSSLYAN